MSSSRLSVTTSAPEGDTPKPSQCDATAGASGCFERLGYCGAAGAKKARAATKSTTVAAVAAASAASAAPASAAATAVVSCSASVSARSTAATSAMAGGGCAAASSGRGSEQNSGTAIACLSGEGDRCARTVFLGNAFHGAHPPERGCMAAGRPPRRVVSSRTSMGDDIKPTQPNRGEVSEIVSGDTKKPKHIAPNTACKPFAFHTYTWFW